MGIALPDEVQSELKGLHESRIQRRTRKEPRELEMIVSGIRGIRDMKLRISYEAMLNTGLRVSELEQIRKNDCIMSEDSIKIHFTGKGGARQRVMISKQNDSDFYDRLHKHIEETQNEDKLFYSAQYLQKKAIAKDFQCHDLRRAFAKVTYKKYKSIRLVQRLLRHKNPKTTKRYLKSKIII